MAIFLLILMLLPASMWAADNTSSATMVAADMHTSQASPDKGKIVNVALAKTDSSAGLPGVPVPATNAFMVAAQPPKPAVHAFFDRQNVLGMAIHAALRSADAAQSCILIGRGKQEAWLPMKSCPAIAAYSMSMVPAQIGSSYLLHRMGYHRLERFMPYAWAAPSAVGIAVSMRAW